MVRTKNYKTTSTFVNVMQRTRKLCYRKDDRTMRPIYGYTEKFRESLDTPTDTFPEIVNTPLLR